MLEIMSEVVSLTPPKDSMARVMEEMPTTWQAVQQANLKSRPQVLNENIIHIFTLMIMFCVGEMALLRFCFECKYVLVKKKGSNSFRLKLESKPKSL